MARARRSGSEGNVYTAGIRPARHLVWQMIADHASNLNKKNGDERQARRVRVVFLSLRIDQVQTKSMPCADRLFRINQIG